MQKKRKALILVIFNKNRL